MSAKGESVRCPVHGTNHEPTDQCWGESTFGCAWGECLRHPAKGDAIFRASSKGEPFVGVCEEHLVHFDGSSQHAE